MKKISIITPCYNEEKNVDKVYAKVKDIFLKLDNYLYEHIFIDNASTDRTNTILREIASRDKNVKIIINTRNFGHIRSPYHALLQAQGDAAIMLVADLQDDPDIIVQFLQKWEQGYKVVMGVKRESEESSFLFMIRRGYYMLLNRLSEIKLTQNFTGFGLYDKVVIAILNQMNDPNPYLRGMISDLGFESAIIEYKQTKRQQGKTKNNCYTLYDLAMLGITNHSKVPLRVATISGFVMSIISFLVALGYLVAKLLYWQRFSLGVAPVIIAIFFFASVQLLFIGILGEYIGSIHTQVLKRPLVIEKERINF